MGKCEWPEGIIFKPDGVRELDPCVYEEVERYKNVTIVITRCKKCGNIDILWTRQENTEKVL